MKKVNIKVDDGEKIVPLLILLALCYVRIQDPWMVNVIRLKALDYHQQQQEVVETSDIVTVAIDDAAMRESGFSWPWPRELIAEQIQELWNLGAQVIIVPVLFSEPDGYGGDHALAGALANTDTIIGQIPSNDTITTPVPRGVATIGEPWEPWVYEYPTISGPRVEFADTAVGVGIMNTSPESDGVLRRMPLVVQSNGELFPSIPLEAIRVLAGDISYQMRTNIAGVDAVRVPAYRTIETDANANIWIDFKYKTPTYSLTEFTSIRDPEIFWEVPNLVGKTVILTPTGAGTDNTIATPVGRINDYDVIATTIQTMIDGRNITRPYWTDLAEIAITVSGAILLSLLVLFTPWFVSAGGVIASLYGVYAYSSYAFTTNSYLIDWSWPAGTLFIVWSVSAFMRFMEELRLKQQIKKQFGTYLSPDMVAMLQKDPSLLKLGGERREMTFMFMDICGFTPISEHYKNKDDPEGLVELVNEFLNDMTTIILDHGGTIDKYMGDCIMAFWNAPLDCPNHAEQACLTAIEVEKKVDELKALYKERGLPDINVGTGINTGTCIVGNMGSETRFDYSVIGDAVNLAARLEATAARHEYIDYKTIVSSMTMEALPKGWDAKEIGRIKVKGKEDTITIYSLPFQLRHWADDVPLNPPLS
jgi:adenylate cyclase